MNIQTVLDHLRGRDDQVLFAEAEAVKHAVFGRQVYLRGIVEFSSHCCKRCLYCGLRAPNARAVRYRLPPGRVVQAALLAPELGLGTVVLQSGDDYSYDVRTLCDMVRAIKDRSTLAVTLSLGDRPLDELARLRDSGADRYLIKLETTDPGLYARLRPGERLEDRLARVEALRRLGYEVGSGIIVGLPGMTGDILARDVLRLAELDLDMLAAGPFVPHPQTPLGGEPCGGLETTLRVTALLRILSPRSNIPATSALNSLPGAGAGPDARARGLHAGCNVIMPSLTPGDVRRGYEIYPGKNVVEAGARQVVSQVRAAIHQEGFVPSAAPGFAPRSTNAAGTARSQAGRGHCGGQERGQVVAD
jgi:biotin synthase